MCKRLFDQGKILWCQNPLKIGDLPVKSLNLLAVVGFDFQVGFQVGNY